MAKLHYFYYFIDSSGLYYGGITDNIAKRQREHRRQRLLGLKSTTKDWHLLQDLITLTPVWSFETRAEAEVYEKQWIINNNKSPLCLNHLRNGNYEYKNHKELCEAGGGYKHIPLVLICTKTCVTTQIESASESERLGLGRSWVISNKSKPNCLHRVGAWLVAKSKAAAEAKLAAWLRIPGECYN